ncbi:efflux RND transporter periplasmic adaptor subunit [Heyndrickxia acidicola]|jgi:multidrug resistance efflux pump|uniref:Efflux RND transporter periplasmic adaptor subunit n=1 Tax=Heyndrickxia acidicola TaxID=209389 RepID=A0ABU6MBV4_9BACI|nr:efflux RND transporter periplasmic adaptor subunit [Heyndrickxia acidicola]MED1201516.1 efflux RND transporter periplasmic adaptor subunit [Heyndrickxia acidicola]
MNSRLLITNIIGFVVVAALVVMGIYFYYQNENYVKTDDAVVSADMMQIVSPSSGVLSKWNVSEGDNVSDNTNVGNVASGKGSSTSITARMAGKIIKNEAKTNQTVQAGQVLAQEADMDHLYIVANIKENDLKDVKVGNSVDVTVDGDPGTTFDGTVKEIGYATNSVFSVLPDQNSTGNYTKVTQKVPVKISLSQVSDKVLPGMNAEVKISK